MYNVLAVPATGPIDFSVFFTIKEIFKAVFVI